MIALLLLAACPPVDRAWPGLSDTGGDGPTVTWTWPLDGALIAEGAALTVQAAVDDPDDALGALALQLEVDGQARQPTLASDGTLTWSTTVTAGAHQGLLVVTDPAGTSAQASRQWSGSAPPTVQITDPADGATINAGKAWQVVVLAEDPDGGTADSYLVLRLDGVEVERVAPWEPDGSSLAVPMQPLGHGAHTVTAEASDGLSTARVSITVYGS